MKLEEQIKAWLTANSTDNVKSLEIEAIAENFAVGFNDFVSEKYTKLNNLYDLKDKSYWNFEGKTIKQLLEIYKKTL